MGEVPDHSSDEPAVSEPLDGRAKRAISIVLLLVIVSFAATGIMIARFVDNTSLVTSLDAGQCVRDWFGDDDGEFLEVLFVPVVDCAEPHAMEVFAVTDSLWFDMSGMPYPGIDETFELGDEWCSEQLALFVGDSVRSDWAVWTFVPVESSWDEGDRTVQCLVGHVDETTLITGTVRNQGTAVGT